MLSLIDRISAAQLQVCCTAGIRMSRPGRRSDYGQPDAPDDRGVHDLVINMKVVMNGAQASLGFIVGFIAVERLIGVLPDCVHPA